MRASALAIVDRRPTAHLPRAPAARSPRRRQVPRASRLAPSWVQFWPMCQQRATRRRCAQRSARPSCTSSHRQQRRHRICFCAAWPSRRLWVHVTPKVPLSGRACYHVTACRSRFARRPRRSSRRLPTTPGTSAAHRRARTESSHRRRRRRARRCSWSLSPNTSVARVSSRRVAGAASSASTSVDGTARCSCGRPNARARRAAKTAWTKCWAVASILRRALTEAVSGASSWCMRRWLRCARLSQRAGCAACAARPCTSPASPRRGKHSSAARRVRTARQRCELRASAVPSGPPRRGQSVRPSMTTIRCARRTSPRSTGSGQASRTSQARRPTEPERCSGTLERVAS
mmetsp:Transcript_7581/g.30806  ORF Transcript_7581/g.30806 Transcript_7581/m.30806 type:complete len:346 (+) Transcript_7581:466-1503(+)